MKLKMHKAINPGVKCSMLIVAFAIFLSPQVNALEVRAEAVPESDIAVLPPVCKLILVETPGAHHGSGRRPLEKHAALFDRPGYEMGKANPHLHHYCWSLIHKQRYFRAKSATERDFRFRQFMGDIDYVLKNSDKDWPYFHVMLLEQGGMLLLRGDYPHALAKADDALRLKPGEEKAYTLKSDIHEAMGDKKKAINIALEGLEKNPASKALRRRLVRLGANIPEFLETSKNTVPNGITPPDTASESNKQTSGIETDAGNTPTPAASTKQPADNPYCRFCP